MTESVQSASEGPSTPTPEACFALARQLEMTDPASFEHLVALYAAAQTSADPTISTAAHLWIGAEAVRRRDLDAAMLGADAALLPDTPMEQGMEALCIINLALLRESGTAVESTRRLLDAAFGGVAPASRARLAYQIGKARADEPDASSYRAYAAVAMAEGGTGPWATWAAHDLLRSAGSHLLSRRYRGAWADLDLLESGIHLLDADDVAHMARQSQRIRGLGDVALRAALWSHEHGDDGAAAAFIVLAASSGNPAVETLAAAAVTTGFDGIAASLAPDQSDDPLSLADALIDAGPTALGYLLLGSVERGTTDARVRDTASLRLATNDYNAGRDVPALRRFLRLVDSDDRAIAVDACLLGAAASLKPGAASAAALDQAERLYDRAGSLGATVRSELGHADVASRRGDHLGAVTRVRDLIAAHPFSAADAWVPARTLAKLAERACQTGALDTARTACELGLGLPRNGFTSAVERAHAAIPPAREGLA